MSKLPKAHKFLDLSDYGRPIAKIIAKNLKNSSVTPVQITYLFFITGLIAVYCILSHQFILATFFLVSKSILDAADGELARVKKTPSYTGRYLDSIADIILNALLLVAITYVSNTMWLLTFIAFLGLQLQGTLYNYYYVILRARSQGDMTSRVIEIGTPVAFPDENQRVVNVLYRIYRVLYGVFDVIIYSLDKGAKTASLPPSWFMTLLSIFGLGFQLLLMGLLLVIGLKNQTIHIIIFATLLIPFFIALRYFLTTSKKQE